MSGARACTFAAALVALICLVFPSIARAAPPDMRLQVDADTVAVGDDVHVTLQATSTSGEAPQNPRLQGVQGFQVRGPSVMSTTKMSIVNGVRTDTRGITASWSLHATKPGMFTVGPPTVDLSGVRYSGQAVQLRVVLPGQAPPRTPAPQMPSPFDPWKGLFQFDLGDDEPQRPPEVQTDPKLSLDTAPAPLVFLRATVDKTHAVVGEQVTLSILLYVDAMSGGDPDFSDVHEATASDFVKRSLLEGDQARFLGMAMAGGRPWHVKLIRKWALFPLKSGDLEIGPMQLARERGQMKRESDTLHVRVTEPPVAGRPPGYAVGDVGRFELSSEVTPREIERGGAVGVTLDLRGTGNLPAQLTPPARAGVEWLTPEIHEQTGAVKNTDKFGGRRVFSYVVRVTKEGDVDLGSVELPFWDPDARAYSVARAALGTIHVKPGALPASADSAPDLLPGLPDARPGLAPPRARARHLADSMGTWLGLGVAPLAWFAFAGARAASRSLREQRAARAADPAAEMSARVAEADGAAKKADPRAADVATARALEAAAIARVRVNLRGTTGERAEEELARAGLDEGHARDLVALYRACEAARFSPDGATVDDARARWMKARGLIKALDRAQRSDAP